jgi:hypothetical protein
MRRMYPLLAAALLALIMAGCGAKANTSGVTDIPGAAPQSIDSSSPWIEPIATASSEVTPSSTAQPSEVNHSPDQQAELRGIGQEVVEALRERDLKSLTHWIDPKLGLRFSPYSHINKDSDLVFEADTLPTFKDTDTLKWGLADGTGDPIELTFRNYFERFVYNQDFADATNVSVNQILGKGNSEFNGTEVYPDASYVEFHFPGFDKKLDGIDWQSLVLVFMPHDGDWKLAAIVHGQWTI